MTINFKNLIKDYSRLYIHFCACVYTEIRVCTDPGKSWKMYRSWNNLEKSWNSEAVVLKMLQPAPLY